MVVLLVLHIEGFSEATTSVPQQDEVATKHREKQPQEVWFCHVVASHGTTVRHCSNKSVTQLKWNNSTGGIILAARTTTHPAQTLRNLPTAAQHQPSTQTWLWCEAPALPAPRQLQQALVQLRNPEQWRSTSSRRGDSCSIPAPGKVLQRGFPSQRAMLGADG